MTVYVFYLIGGILTCWESPATSPQRAGAMIDFLRTHPPNRSFEPLWSDLTQKP